MTLNMALMKFTMRASLVVVVSWLLIYSSPLQASYEDGLDSLSRLHNLVVIQDGEVVLEHHQAGPGPAEAANIKSLSKSLLSLLAGIAIDKGYFELYQPISELLGSHQPSQTPADLSQIRIEHLLSMQSGLQHTSRQNYGDWVNSDNWTRYALTRPMVGEPGGEMLYSTGNSHILAAILTEQTGRSLLQLMREWVGGPLNIYIHPWPQSPEGIYFGGNDMLISAHGLAWVGQLYVNQGMANGQAVVSEQWIKESFTPRTNSAYTGDPYGLGWFSYQLNDVQAFYGRGYGGQILYIIPAYKLSIAMTSDPTPPSQGGYINRQHRFIEEYILPRFSDR